LGEISSKPTSGPRRSEYLRRHNFRLARHSGESKYAIHSGIREGGCGWQVLPADAPDLEEAALRACEFMSPGILESARGRGRRGGLEVGDQEGAEIVEAGEGIHSPAKGRARS